MYKKLRKSFRIGRKVITSSHYADAERLNKQEYHKLPSRTVLINFLLSSMGRDTTYLEIGVRNPDHNYSHIRSHKKYSVDPGVEFEANPVDFKLTSDDFFEQLRSAKILTPDTKFDVIFVDGLHLADQVDRDIENALDFVEHDGFVVLHDCNPPTEWHAREEFYYHLSPAELAWNGTTWKAFYKWRTNSTVYSCCVDTDYGVGIISKKRSIGNSMAQRNPFYEYKVLAANRAEHLGLISFGELQQRLGV